MMHNALLFAVLVFSFTSTMDDLAYRNPVVWALLAAALWIVLAVFSIYKANRYPEMILQAEKTNAFELQIAQIYPTSKFGLAWLQLWPVVVILSINKAKSLDSKAVRISNYKVTSNSLTNSPTLLKPRPSCNLLIRCLEMLTLVEF
jgi:hypothetical protein